jgi:hypothetical protein
LAHDGFFGNSTLNLCANRENACANGERPECVKAAGFEGWFVPAARISVYGEYGRDALTQGDVIA